MLKFCTAATIVPWKGETLRLTANSVWRANDPFVVAHPEMFADTPEVVETSSGAVYRGAVEQASAAPGEKRNSR